MWRWEKRRKRIFRHLGKDGVDEQKGKGSRPREKKKKKKKK